MICPGLDLEALTGHSQCPGVLFPDDLPGALIWKHSQGTHSAPVCFSRMICPGLDLEALTGHSQRPGVLFPDDLP